MWNLITDLLFYIFRWVQYKGSLTWFVYNQSSSCCFAVQDPLFTLGQFWPSEYCGCLLLCVHPSVRLCVNHMLARAITQHPFKTGSPNLDQTCKTPCLRLLLFWGAIDIDLQCQIQTKSQNLPHFEHVHTPHPFKLGSSNSDQTYKTSWLRSLLVSEVIDLDLKGWI